MKINCFSVTFWFNIFDNHNSILEDFQNKLKDEFVSFNIKSLENNLISPVITGFNNKKMTNFSMSQINLQYSMDKVNMSDFADFKIKVFDIFEILSLNGIEIAHTALFINGEFVNEKALEKITSNTFSNKLVTEDLIDATIKLGKKEDDLFYKIITILNKKQIKLPRKVDKLGRLVPMPLISWNGALVENELIDVSYEINDKYSFDFAKNYHTTEFFLNKMLYLMENNYESDIESLLDKGIF